MVKSSPSAPSKTYRDAQVCGWHRLYQITRGCDGFWSRETGVNIAPTMEISHGESDAELWDFGVLCLIVQRKHKFQWLGAFDSDDLYILDGMYTIYDEHLCQYPYVVNIYPYIIYIY